MIYCVPVKVLLPACLWGGGVGHPGKVLQVCHVHLVSLSADLWAPRPHREHSLFPRLLFLKIKIF